MGSMGGTFTIPEFNSSYTITDSNLVRIGDKKFLEKNHVPPPFYLIFTSENHLNAHSSFIKQHMAMNFAPLDCSCQGASFEPKKIYLAFSVLEKFAKNQKIHIFDSHSKKWVQWAELCRRSQPSVVPARTSPGAAESPSHHSRHRGSHVRPKEPTVGAHSAHGHRLRRARDRCVCPLLCASPTTVLCVFRGTCRFPSGDAVRAVRQPLN
jgi:hypothetical protein